MRSLRRSSLERTINVVLVLAAAFGVTSKRRSSRVPSAICRTQRACASSGWRSRVLSSSLMAAGVLVPFNVRIRREVGKVIRMCIQRRLVSSQERQVGAVLPATDAEPGSTGLVHDGSRTEQWILLAKWGVDRVRRIAGAPNTFRMPPEHVVEKFFVQNFGCRATQAVGAALERLLAGKGLASAGERAGADLVVLNTCTVTSSTDDDVRQPIRRVHRENPDARILVTGCYAQRAPQELASMAGVEWVVGNSYKTQIAEIVMAAPYHGNIHIGDIFEQRDFLSAPVEDAAGDRTRPNLKIQDGCNNRCSFCIIPFVRGPSRGAPAEQAIEQVRALARRYREIVLSGINLGRWGREPGSTMRLADLLRRLLGETDVERLRLSSVEPMDFSDDLLQLMTESPRIATHVHAPLQSGCDRTLRRMHRKYRPRHYADRVQKARALMPDAGIGADVMVGFPGETDAEFEESRQFMAAIDRK